MIRHSILLPPAKLLLLETLIVLILLIYIEFYGFTESLEVLLHGFRKHAKGLVLGLVERIVGPQILTLRARKPYGAVLAADVSWQRANVRDVLASLVLLRDWAGAGGAARCHELLEVRQFLCLAEVTLENILGVHSFIPDHTSGFVLHHFIDEGVV